jgi:hypothetical protein
MHLERRSAVGTNDPEILETVVIRHTVDVIDDERHPRPVPALSLAAQLAETSFQAGVE